MAAFLEAQLNEGLAARFWAKVDKNGPVPAHCPELGPCWIWTAATDPKGYGKFSVFTVLPAPRMNRVFFAHRVSMALAGTIPPDDLQGCHHCDNPPCVNPAHLFLGTHDENMMDMTSKGRSGRLAICRNGHIQNAINAHWYFWHGYWLRRCRACERERGPQKKARQAVRECSEEGCGKPVKQSGLCSMHNSRQYRAARAQKGT